MRKLIALIAVALVALLVISCESMRGALSGAISGAAGSVGASAASAPSGTAAAAASVASVDFQAGEVLASADAGKAMNVTFYVAKVLQAATAATKNQAQVVFIGDGSKSWVNYVVGSRKATKADFVVGATMFYLSGWQNHDEISLDSYRKDGWRLGTITSVEELYKNLVEIDGDSYNVNYLRVPTDPIK